MSTALKNVGLVVVSVVLSSIATTIVCLSVMPRAAQAERPAPSAAAASPAPAGVVAKYEYKHKLVMVPRFAQLEETANTLGKDGWLCDVRLDHVACHRPRHEP